MAVYRVRSVFISDVHLGTRACNAELLIEFLRDVETEYLYLAGDIIDFERLQRRACWPKTHAAVLREILGHARRGAQVMYIPGNHDAMLRAHAGLTVGGVQIRLRHVHLTHDGKRLLIVHGDEFDVRCKRLTRKLGALCYVGIMHAQVAGNVVRAQFGLSWWSLAGFLKQRLRRVDRYVRRFEHAAARAARRQKVDGVICGHIHHPRLARINGIRYCNTGDWVESCSSLVEHHDGRLELVRWAARRAALPLSAAAAAA